MNASKFYIKDLGKKLAFLLSIIPAFLTGILILKYGVNVPFWDQWPLASMFQKIYAGNLTFQDLIAQHNESRKFFPRLLFIGMAYLTGWNVKYEMLVIFILACLVSFNIYRLSLVTVGGRAVKLLWLACLSNLLIFSPIQCDNWLFGIQVVAFTPIACLTSCILLAYSSLSLRNKILIGIVLSTISTFSYANGLLCWILAFPAIALAKPKAWQELLQQKWLIGGWVIGFISNAALYFYDYKKPPHHPSLNDGLLHPLKAVNYFLAFLGTPVAQNTLYVATIVGTILIIAVIFLGFYLLKFWRQNNLLHRSIGWWCIAGYSLISGAITTSGRVGFGVDQSLSTRYTTFSLYLIVALIYLIPIVWEDAADRGFLNRNDLTLNRAISSILTVFIFLYAITAAYGIEQMQEIQVDRFRGKACLTFVNVVNTDECLIWLWNDPNDKQAQATILKILKKRANILDKMGYLDPKLATSPNIKSREGNKIAGLEYGWLDKIEIVGKDKYRVSGWAVLPEKVKAADGVVLTYENKSGESVIFAIAPLQIRRSDVAKALNNKVYRYSGWEKVLSAKEIPPEARTIKAWGLDAETGKAFELSGERNININS